MAVLLVATDQVLYMAENDAVVCGRHRTMHRSEARLTKAEVQEWLGLVHEMYRSTVGCEYCRAGIAPFRTKED